MAADPRCLPVAIPPGGVFKLPRRHAKLLCWDGRSLKRSAYVLNPRTSPKASGLTQIDVFPARVNLAKQCVSVHPG